MRVNKIFRVVHRDTPLCEETRDPRFGEPQHEASLTAPSRLARRQMRVRMMAPATICYLNTDFEVTSASLRRPVAATQPG